MYPTYALRTKKIRGQCKIFSFQFIQPLCEVLKSATCLLGCDPTYLVAGQGSLVKGFPEFGYNLWSANLCQALYARYLVTG